MSLCIWSYGVAMKLFIVHSSDNAYKRKYAQLLCYSLACALLMLYLSKCVHLYCYRDFVVAKLGAVKLLYKHVEVILAIFATTIFALPSGIELDTSYTNTAGFQADCTALHDAKI